MRPRRYPSHVLTSQILHKPREIELHSISGTKRAEHERGLGLQKGMHGRAHRRRTSLLLGARADEASLSYNEAPSEIIQVCSLHQAMSAEVTGGVHAAIGLLTQEFTLACQSSQIPLYDELHIGIGF